MRALPSLLLPLLLMLLSVASPALARVAAIETTAPLADHSKESIEAALTQAVKTAVQGAVAMGLTWIQVRQAVVFSDAVSVRIFASDGELQDEDGAEPEPEESVQPARIEI